MLAASDLHLSLTLSGGAGAARGLSGFGEHPTARLSAVSPARQSCLFLDPDHCFSGGLCHEYGLCCEPFPDVVANQCGATDRQSAAIIVDSPKSLLYRLLERV